MQVRRSPSRGEWQGLEIGTVRLQSHKNDCLEAQRAANGAAHISLSQPWLDELETITGRNENLVSGFLLRVVRY